jgi:hypothetical protein
MKESNVVLRGVVPAAVSLLIFAGLVLAAVIEIDINITPQHLSLSKGYVRFVRCNISSEYQVGNPGACSLAIDGAEPIGAVKVESHIEEHDTTVVFFFVDDVQKMLSEAGAIGEVTLTLTINGEDTLIGSDTITVTE